MGATWFSEKELRNMAVSCCNSHDADIAPLDWSTMMQGTLFQIKTWNKLGTIPLSYRLFLDLFTRSCDSLRILTPPSTSTIIKSQESHGSHACHTFHTRFSTCSEFISSYVFHFYYDSFTKYHKSHYSVPLQSIDLDWISLPANPGCVPANQAPLILKCNHHPPYHLQPLTHSPSSTIYIITYHPHHNAYSLMVGVLSYPICWSWCSSNCPSHPLP